MTSRRRSLRTCSPRTRTANGSQSRDAGFLYTSGPDAVVFGGRGTRDCATTDTIASTHLGKSIISFPILPPSARGAPAWTPFATAVQAGRDEYWKRVLRLQEDRKRTRLEIHH